MPFHLIICLFLFVGKPSMQKQFEWKASNTFVYKICIKWLRKLVDGWMQFRTSKSKQRISNIFVVVLCGFRRVWFRFIMKYILLSYQCDGFLEICYTSFFCSLHCGLFRCQLGKNLISIFFFGALCFDLSGEVYCSIVAIFCLFVWRKCELAGFSILKYYMRHGASQWPSEYDVSIVGLHRELHGLTRPRVYSV